MQIYMQLAIPLRIICVQCGMEISGKPNDPVAQCPKCGFKVRIEAGPQAMNPLNLPTGKTTFKRPPPAA